MPTSEVYIYIYIFVKMIILYIYIYIYSIYIYIYSIHVYIYTWGSENRSTPNHPNLDHFSIETHGFGDIYVIYIHTYILYIYIYIYMYIYLSLLMLGRYFNIPAQIHWKNHVARARRHDLGSNRCRSPRPGYLVIEWWYHWNITAIGLSLEYIFVIFGVCIPHFQTHPSDILKIRTPIYHLGVKMRSTYPKYQGKWWLTSGFRGT